MYWIAGAALAVALIVWFGIAATTGGGLATRIVQRVYYAVGSLERFQKTGRRHESLHAIVGARPPSWLSRIVQRVWPSQAPWFTGPYPTDKLGYHSYLPIYDALFSPLRDEPGLRVLEVGVKKGGSLALWREYFHESTAIWGIDTNPDVPKFSNDARIKVLVLDSREPAAVRSALGSLTFDIIVDDGAHRPEDQWRTFTALWPHLAPTGLYVIEDVFDIDEARYRDRVGSLARHRDGSGQELVVLRPATAPAPARRLESIRGRR